MEDYCYYTNNNTVLSSSSSLYFFSTPPLLLLLFYDAAYAMRRTAPSDLANKIPKLIHLRPATVSKPPSMGENLYASTSTTPDFQSMVGKGVVISQGAMVAAEAKLEGDVFVGSNTTTSR